MVFVLWVTGWDCSVVSGVGGRKGYHCHSLDLGSPQNALAIALVWSYLGVGGWPPQKTLSSPRRFRGTSETTSQRGETSRGPRPSSLSQAQAFATQEIVRAPNRPALPNKSSKQNSLACPMLLWPLGGACNPRLRRESPFKHSSYEKEKREGGAQALQWM